MHVLRLFEATLTVRRMDSRTGQTISSNQK